MMHSLKALALAAAIVALPLAALADSKTVGVDVGTSVAKVGTLTVKQKLLFGTYDPQAQAATKGSTILTEFVTLGTAFTITPPAGDQNLTSGANILKYAFTTPAVSASGQGQATDYTFNAEIHPGQNVPVGSYTGNAVFQFNF